MLGSKGEVVRRAINLLIKIMRGVKVRELYQLR